MIYNNIDINDFDYELPKDRIAMYPVTERDGSKLLLLKDGKISEDVFRNIDRYVKPDSLLVFNNSRVIRARLLFGKVTGATIEVLCLEPLSPAEYELSFSSKKSVEWKCIIGNLKKWKEGRISINFIHRNKKYLLEAEKKGIEEGDAWRVKFTWNSDDLTFGEVIEAAGHVPLPPYIDRQDELTDSVSYQTVYSKVKGSVAAPTAGLHFTEDVLDKLHARGIITTEITLHVGAGTFQPVKANDISRHEMHCEHFIVTRGTIEKLILHEGRIIPVGTTSVRTLETLYWLGVKLLSGINMEEFSLGQWEPYKNETEISVEASLNALLNNMIKNNLLSLHASTNIMIVPGYKFRLTSGLITNFHQPRSTLLLLISAWTGERWKEVYKHALDNNFRFLSYGDCSLLYR